MVDYVQMCDGTGLKPWPTDLALQMWVPHGDDRCVLSDQLSHWDRALLCKAADFLPYLRTAVDDHVAAMGCLIVDMLVCRLGHVEGVEKLLSLPFESFVLTTSAWREANKLSQEDLVQLILDHEPTYFSSSDESPRLEVSSGVIRLQHSGYNMVEKAGLHSYYAFRIPNGSDRLCPDTIDCLTGTLILSGQDIVEVTNPIVAYLSRHREGVGAYNQVLVGVPNREVIKGIITEGLPSAIRTINLNGAKGSVMGKVHDASINHAGGMLLKHTQLVNDVVFADLLADFVGLPSKYRL